MKFSEYQNELTEAFDRPAQITARRGNKSFFNVGDKRYIVELAYEEYDKSINVEFMYMSPESPTWSYNLAKGDARDAITVFATVISEIKELMRSKDVNYIHFNAFSDSNADDYRKRLSVYKRIAKRFADELGFKVVYDMGSISLERLNKR